MKPIAPLVWFYQGFQPVSVLLAMINFAVIINLWITAKGFYISAWSIPVIGIAIGLLLIVVGGFQHYFNIQQAIVSYTNTRQNAEIVDIQKKVDEILDRLKQDEMEALLQEIEYCERLK